MAPGGARSARRDARSALIMSRWSPRTREVAEAAAVDQVNLTDEQRKRLVLQERP